MKVLIVEPDWHFARRAFEYLEGHAHHAVLQPDARELLRQTRHWQPDLVILAAECADGSTLETLHTLPDRPAVLLTGRMDRFEIAWRAWQHGGDELLMKPIFKIEELEHAIVTARENAVRDGDTRRAARASA